jgi:presequence protease
LKHTKTGAEYFHVKQPKDKNNFFSIGFRTPPRDNTGEPHILEHLILCGSKKYPVRDPFFMMLRRSMKTYLNAWTCKKIVKTHISVYDKTIYLFSSQIEKDYQNLMNLYMDSVFFPLLNFVDFQQEGFRLDFQKDRHLEYKGIVYNEMKGAMSSPDE